MNVVAKTLGELVDVKGGKRLPKGTPYSPVPTEHPYIRVTNIRGNAPVGTRNLDIRNFVFPAFRKSRTMGSEIRNPEFVTKKRRTQRILLSSAEMGYCF